MDRLLSGFGQGWAPIVRKHKNGVGGMAFDQVLGSIAGAAAGARADVAGSIPGGGLQGGLTGPGGSFHTHLAQNAPAPSPVPATTPMPDTPSLPTPNQDLRSGQTVPISQVQRPHMNSLGQDVLNSLERFGDRTNALRKLSTEWRRGGGGGGGGDKAGGGVDKLGTHAMMAGPAQRMPPPSAPQADKGPDKGMDGITEQYRDMMHESMGRQAELYGLVIDVELGRQVASTATSTAKTLLTQSG